MIFTVITTDADEESSPLEFRTYPKKENSESQKKKNIQKATKRNPIIKPQPEFNFEESMKTLVVK